MHIPNKFNGYNADGRRLYFKGGDGGAGAAQQQEAERQARIKAAVDTINSVFDSKTTTKGVGRVSAYNPGATYYDAQGNVWSAPSATPGANDGILGVATQAANQAAIDKALADGLYSGRETTEPTLNRDQLYDQQKQAVYDINAKDVNKQFAEAERQNRFGLARSGLLGGSADVDSNALLQDKTNEGLLKASGIADQAASDLKTADERSRQSLISMAQSGIDTGTAQAMALRNLDATAQNASANRTGASVGSLFDDLGQAYLLRQASAGQRAGLAANAQQNYGVSSPTQVYGGSVT